MEVKYTYRNYKKVGYFTLGILTQTAPAPNNKMEARRFLGMTTQLSKFCPQLSEQAKPIRDPLSAKNEWLWGEPQQKSFDSIKRQHSTSLVLALFDPERETINLQMLLLMV